MATPTYTLIEEQVLGSSAASVTFSSIPQTPYKDLVLEVVGADSTVNGYCTVRFNSDSGSNYSRTNLYGNGSSAISNRNPNLAQLYITIGASGALATSTFSVFQYANTNVYKTAIMRDADAAAQVGAQVGLWRSTAAITQITLGASSTTIASGSIFRLWGIA